MASPAPFVLQGLQTSSQSRRSQQHRILRHDSCSPIDNRGHFREGGCLPPSSARCSHTAASHGNLSHPFQCKVLQLSAKASKSGFCQVFSRGCGPQPGEQSPESGNFGTTTRSSWPSLFIALFAPCQSRHEKNPTFASFFRLFCGNCLIQNQTQKSVCLSEPITCTQQVAC